MWGTVDFDSKNKILRGETRAQGVPIHEEEKKVKTRIYIIILKCPPLKYQTAGCWGEGGVLPSDCINSKQNVQYWAALLVG